METCVVNRRVSRGAGEFGRRGKVGAWTGEIAGIDRRDLLLIDGSLLLFPVFIFRARSSCRDGFRLTVGAGGAAWRRRIQSIAVQVEGHAAVGRRRRGIRSELV